MRNAKRIVIPVQEIRLPDGFELKMTSSSNNKNSIDSSFKTHLLVFKIIFVCLGTYLTIFLDQQDQGLLEKIFLKKKKISHLFI